MNNGNDMRSDRLSAGEEREVGKVLGLASDPPLPEGAAARLMARIAAEPQEARIILLPQRAAARRNPLRYAAALPLAASLALGVYLGAQGMLDFMLPTALTDGFVVSEDLPDELGGVSEAEAYAEESLS
jgi:hypothetical protein